jgi:hypothetical protein
MHTLIMPSGRDVMPGLPPSEAQLFSALADFDGDGYVSVEDLQAAGEWEACSPCMVADLGEKCLPTNSLTSANQSVSYYPMQAAACNDLRTLGLTAQLQLFLVVGD